MLIECCSDGVDAVINFTQINCFIITADIGDNQDVFSNSGKTLRFLPQMAINVDNISMA